MFVYITSQLAQECALFCNKHVELILVTPFQAYLTNNSLSAVFTVKIILRLCRSIIIKDLSTVIS